MSLHYLSLAEVATLIRTRALSPVEAVQAQLARIRELDPTLNAYTLVTEESALVDARAAEVEIMAGNYRGPLHGIPIAVKDLFFTKGVRTQGGLKVLAGHFPERDAVAVERLRQAGAIVLGKLHTTEGAMDGYHRDFPIPSNPWDARRWPGVSSSGSGVAVAAGLCYAALSTDTGGSVRIPAAANGIAGLKPTRGSVSTEGVLPLAPSFDTVGAMARSVGDVAILLQALTGAHLETPPMAGVRIGFDEERCSNEAVRVLKTCGARVVAACLPALDEVSEIWYTIAATEAALAHRETFPARHAEYGEGFREFLERGQSISAMAYDDAQKRRAIWSARVEEWFRDFDVFVCPSLPGEAFRYNPEDAYRGQGNGIPAAYLTAMDRLVLPFNLNGYPALSVPCGVSAEGMPLGLQLAGPAGSEPLLLACGTALEHLRHPPV